jgi:hypothetical protein
MPGNRHGIQSVMPWTHLSSSHDHHIAARPWVGREGSGLLPLEVCQRPHGCRGPVTAAMGHLRLREEMVATCPKLWAGHHVVLERCQLPGQMVHPLKPGPHLRFMGQERPVEYRRRLWSADLRNRRWHQGDYPERSDQKWPIFRRIVAIPPSHALRERGLCSTWESGCHPERPNALQGKGVAHGEGRLSEPHM